MKAKLQANSMTSSKAMCWVGLAFLKLRIWNSKRGKEKNEGEGVKH